MLRVVRCVFWCCLTSRFCVWSGVLGLVFGMVVGLGGGLYVAAFWWFGGLVGLVIVASLGCCWAFLGFLIFLVLC